MNRITAIIFLTLLQSKTICQQKTSEKRRLDRIINGNVTVGNCWAPFRPEKKNSPIFAKISPVLNGCAWNSNPLDFLRTLFCFKDTAFYLGLIFLTVHKQIIFNLCHFCTTKSIFTQKFESVLIFSISFNVQEII